MVDEGALSALLNRVNDARTVRLDARAFTSQGSGWQITPQTYKGQPGLAVRADDWDLLAALKRRLEQQRVAVGVRGLRNKYLHVPRVGR